MSYQVGIDIGSTTLKAVVLDDKNKLIYKSYERHLSKVKELTIEKIKQLGPYLKGQDIKIAITGSAGLGVAESSGIAFVQEVFATAGGVKKYYPETDIVIELGGEDAKIIFLQGAVEERMNSTCAGGTGSFIDQMASLLNLSLAELDELSLQYRTIYPIASRCGVFAKTDIQALVNQGAGKEDICASIFQAVVSQTISGLAQGRPLEGNILFLGGPLAFLKGLQNRFRETLHLSGHQAVFPADAQYFVAMGAATYAEKLEKTFAYDEIVNRLSQMHFTEQTAGGLEPLFRDEQEYQEFLQAHEAARVENRDIGTYEGDAYLGIDAGSTTTKIVLMSEENEILYSYYAANLGSPLKIVQDVLGEVYDRCGRRVRIRSGAVTGYGEELIKNAFGLDLGLVETVAHYTAASAFEPEVDFIIDIGGQDIKCFEIKDRAISSVMLNEACSSGCGSFVETFAKSLGYDIGAFVQLSLYGKHPVDLGTRCTVFMNSSVKQAQKNGATIADISAGLAISVVKNAIYKVIRAHSAEALGKHIVVQGGTFLNDAVLRSFERLIGRQVTRPNISGLMGAYGAALYAKAHCPAKTALLSPEELKQFTHGSKVVNCGLCTNQCALTINTFSGGRKYISGNRCERPVTGQKSTQLPNLYQFKLHKLKSFESKGGKRGRIGIPFALNLYDNYPFWFTYFDSLGFEVVRSDVSSRKLHALGEHTIPSDTVCYPAKLVHGHIMNLIQKGVKTIFYPCMTFNFDEKISDRNFNCPVVAYYPEVIQGNIKFSGDTAFYYPYVDLNNRRFFKKRIWETVVQMDPSVTKKESDQAADQAYRVYEQYRLDVLAEGKRAFAYAKANGLKTIVLAGRPYHVDPEINHGIDKLITTLGFVILSEDSVMDQGEPQALNVLNQWTYHARMYQAARFVNHQQDTQLVQLVSFGCGIDAVTTDEVSDILRKNDRLYTEIKIDEINNLGAVKIRLRSLLAAMNERKEGNQTARLAQAD